MVARAVRMALTGVPLWRSGLRTSGASLGRTFFAARIDFFSCVWYYRSVTGRGRLLTEVRLYMKWRPFIGRLLSFSTPARGVRRCGL